MSTQQKKYWSKKEYTERIADWKLDIAHAQAVRNHSSKNYMGAYVADSDANIVKSLVEGLKLHKVLYKIYHLNN